MLFTNPTQIIVLALVLIGGWALGLASHPGGKKWKRRYQEEKATHARNRDLAEAKARADAARIAALEHANTDLARERDMRVIPTDVRDTSYVAPRWTGRRWFDWQRTRV